MNTVEQAAYNLGQRTQQIGERSYTLTLMPAIKGFTLGTKLVKSLLPALGSYFDRKDPHPLFPEEQNLWATAASLLVRELDSLEVEEIISTLLGGLSVDGSKANIDIVFAGHYGQLLSVIEWSLKENCGDFFTEYFKGKGIEIPSLKEMWAQAQVQQEAPTPEESETK